MADMSEILLIEEVAELLRTPRSTLRYWRHIGEGPKSFKIGGRVAYKRADVEAWLEEQYAGGR
jgi:excisionase family DNA binding protein